MPKVEVEIDQTLYDFLNEKATMQNKTISEMIEDMTYLALTHMISKKINNMYAEPDNTSPTH